VDFAITGGGGTGTLSPGQTRSLTVTFRPAASGTRSASLMIASNAPGSPHSVPLSGTGTTPPSLEVTKTADVSSAAPGAMLNFLLTVRNTGGGPATGVVLSDPIPTGTTAVAASDGGVIANGVASWSLGSLAAGASRQVSLSVRVNNDATGRISNVAQVRSAEVSSPIASNNTSTTVSGGSPSLILTKAVDKTGAATGDLLTYTLTYRNTGSATANPVTISDPLPAGTVLVEVPNASQLIAGTLRINLGRLSAEASGSVLFRVKISSSVGGTTITNQASVSGSDFPQAIFSNIVTTIIQHVDDSPQLRGSWGTVRAESIGGTYYYALNQTDRTISTATWTARLNVPDGTRCRVWAFVPYKSSREHPSPRTSQATYEITHSEGQSTVTISHQVEKSQWVPLGVFPFRTGTFTVRLSDRTGEPQVTTTLAADAIGWTSE
jgi:uncharacterized repeat protein (TIGR01451 family)